MKKQILKLGKALEKQTQKTINGGGYPGVGRNRGRECSQDHHCLTGYRNSGCACSGGYCISIGTHPGPEGPAGQPAAYC